MMLDCLRSELLHPTDDVGDVGDVDDDADEDGDAVGLLVLMVTASNRCSLITAQWTQTRSADLKILFGVLQHCCHNCNSMLLHCPKHIQA